jgi:pilus assembly protein CpaB
MGRRKILLPLAALIAAVGTLMVFLYVQGAEGRADAKYDAVEVLRAVKQINPGEKFDDAARASKFQLQTVPRDELLTGAQDDLSALGGTVATQTIYPGEQITDNKWGASAVAATDLTIPKGMQAISVNLTDPGRVAGFVNPGSEVSIFMAGTRTSDGTAYTRLLLQRVQVLGIGATGTTTSTKTTKSGEQTTEEIPQTLMTLAVNQEDAQRVLYAATNGVLAVGLLTKDSEETRSDFTTEQNLFQ